jgi:hypothetical protein
MSRRASATWMKRELMFTMVPEGIPHTDDPDLEMAFIRAQHRYLNDFVGKYPPVSNHLLLPADRESKAPSRR